MRRNLRRHDGWIGSSPNARLGFRTLKSRPSILDPLIDEDSSDWWAAVDRREFALPGCLKCHLRWFPPTPGCPRCGSAAVELRPASGHGFIYSWVVVHRALHEAFVHDVPYVIATIQLDEGGRIFGRLLRLNEYSRIGPNVGVHATFYEVEHQVLVGFVLDSDRRKHVRRHSTL